MTSISHKRHWKGINPSHLLTISHSASQRDWNYSLIASLISQVFVETGDQWGMIDLILRLNDWWPWVAHIYPLQLPVKYGCLHGTTYEPRNRTWELSGRPRNGTGHDWLTGANTTCMSKFSSSVKKEGRRQAMIQAKIEHLQCGKRVMWSHRFEMWPWCIVDVQYTGSVVSIDGENIDL